MRSVVRSLVVSAVVIGSAVSVGAARADSAAEGAQHAHHAGLVDVSAPELGLKSEQTDALKKLDADVQASRDALKAAKRDLKLAMADQFEAGKLDPQALEPQTKKVIDAAEAVGQAERAALEKSRDVLDPQQRIAVAQRLRERASKHAGMRSGERFDRMARTLNLTQEQALAIRGPYEELVAAHAAEHARMAIVAELYLTSGAPLDVIAPPGVARQRAEQLVRAGLAVAGRIAEILTPEQRKAAADAIRKELSDGPPKREENVGKQSTP